ncbi:MAG: hypothetical protein H0S85_12600 [Desulfovibrionaceae bacterium]|jgi:hypothetical protein|nr:hypothetical protein [Desulfovibrionaceae bacterium]
MEHVATREELQQALRDKRIVILVKGRELAGFVDRRKRSHRRLLLLGILILAATVGMAFAAQNLAETELGEFIGTARLLDVATVLLILGTVLGSGCALTAILNPLRPYRYIRRTAYWSILHRV